MFKLVLVLLVSFIGFKSWSGPAKSKKPKTGKPVVLKRSSSKSLIPKKVSSKLTSGLNINKALKDEVKQAMQEMVDKIHKSGPKLLIQKKIIFKESKQILGALSGKTGEKESLNLLVSLVSKQSLLMMSTKSKKQIENFQFLLTSINSRLVSSNVSLQKVLKQATEDYVVARKKISDSKKKKEGSKFLEDLKKRCNI